LYSEKLLRKVKESEETYRSLALIDELTGIYNRRGLLTLGEYYLRMVRRQKKCIYMLYADFDDLKTINDTWGHQEGDTALIETAGVLKNNFRESDIIARIGGDEFVVILVDTTSDSIDTVIDRLKKAVEINNSEGNHAYRLSLSVGIAFCDPEHPVSIEELVSQADRHMYDDKKRK
jgi:diguanylate cyclase (GGDEF)-like protein